MTADTQTPSNKSWLITGANRGIGLALVRTLSQDDHHVIFCGVREPSTATDLLRLKERHANIHVIKMVSADDGDATAAADYIAKVSGRLDYVIANAGIRNTQTSVLHMTRDDFDDHNMKSVFVAISTIGASVTLAAEVPFPNAAYGGRKAGLNFLVHKLALEQKQDRIIVIPVHPGAVDTDMMKSGLPHFPPEVQQYIQTMSISPDKSAVDIIKLAETVTIEDTGKFYSHDGKEIPW